MTEIPEPADVVLDLRDLVVAVNPDAQYPSLRLSDGENSVELSTGLPGVTPSAALTTLHLAMAALTLAELMRTQTEGSARQGDPGS